MEGNTRYTFAEALAELRALGTPEEMMALAERGYAPPARLRCNSHIHLPPNFSAFVSVEQAVDLADTQDVRVVGVTNYYDYEVYGDFALLARRRGVFPLFGLEIIALIERLVREGVKINDPGNPGRIYVCGKGATGFSPMSAEAQRLLEIIRRNDRQRMGTMVRRLAEVFEQRGLPLGLDENDVIEMVVRRHACPRHRVYLQERHICQAFQEALFERVPVEKRPEKLAAVLGVPPKAGPQDAVKIQNEIRTHLLKAGKPAFVEERFLSFEEAYRMILELGGVPCYPTLADGTSPICPYEQPVEALIARIREAGMYAAEFIPVRNSPEVLRQYVLAMRAAGLVVTGGTEHNTLDLLPIEPTCVKGAPVPEDVRDVFWEGACVVAAHQFLCAHGRCGFVDGKGRPNPDYRGDEQRIAAFRRLGAAVIRRYMDATGRRETGGR